MDHEDIKLYQPVPDDMDGAFTVWSFVAKISLQFIWLLSAAEENGPQVQTVSEEQIISTGNRGSTANPMETEYSGHYEVGPA